MVSTTEKTARLAESDRLWSGYLDRDNTAAVASRLLRLLEGKHFTFAEIRGTKNWTEIRTGERIVPPGRVGDLAVTVRDIGSKVGFYVHHAHSGTMIVAGLAEGDPGEVARVYFSFGEQDQFTIDQKSDSGMPLHWTWAVEQDRDHLRPSFTPDQLKEVYQALSAVTPVNQDLLGLLRQNLRYHYCFEPDGRMT